MEPENTCKVVDNVPELEKSVSHVEDLPISEDPEFFKDIGIEELSPEGQFLKAVMPEVERIMPNYYNAAHDLEYTIDAEDAVGPLLAAGKNLPTPFVANAHELEDLAKTFLE